MKRKFLVSLLTLLLVGTALAQEGWFVERGPELEFQLEVPAEEILGVLQLRHPEVEFHVPAPRALAAYGTHENLSLVSRHILHLGVGAEDRTTVHLIPEIRDERPVSSVVVSRSDSQTARRRVACLSGQGIQLQEVIRVRSNPIAQIRVLRVDPYFYIDTNGREELPKALTTPIPKMELEIERGFLTITGNRETLRAALDNWQEPWMTTAQAESSMTNLAFQLGLDTLEDIQSHSRGFKTLTNGWQVTEAVNNEATSQQTQPSAVWVRVSSPR